MNVDRYRHADRTYVNIFAAYNQFFNSSPGAHAPGYIYAAASRLIPALGHILQLVSRIELSKFERLLCGMR